MERNGKLERQICHWIFFLIVHQRRIEKHSERVVEKIEWEHSIFFWSAINACRLNRVTVGFFDTHLRRFLHFSPLDWFLGKTNSFERLRSSLGDLNWAENLMGLSRGFSVSEANPRLRKNDPLRAQRCGMARTRAISSSKIIMTVDYDYYFLNLKYGQLRTQLMWTCKTQN